VVTHVLTLALLSSQIELIMEAIHKTRKMQYKKTMEAKRLCEQRCRDKDDAEQAVPHNTNVITQRQETKLERFTSRALPPVENIEEEWQKEHVKACEVNFFETQECEWINYFCNALWLYLSPPRHVWVFGLHKVQAGLISCLPTSSGRAFVEHRARALGVPEPRRSSALPFLLCRRAPLPTLTSAPEFLPDYAIGMATLLDAVDPVCGFSRQKIQLVWPVR
uniref:Uncharacterized protein n=1 Tax=Melopsittacus undulatus TaxID=13146 RepID=A0A8V5GEA6_MELUD